jgi:hypothetical protein
MGRKVTRAMAKIDAAGAAAAEPLMLADARSPWASDLYIAVSGHVADAAMAAISGTFLTDVFDGPFRDARTWVETMKGRVAARGRRLRRILLGYTTCPACAKAYGHNYVIVFAEVDPAPGSPAN